MYPFERFTETSKQVLTFAQQEAERSHHSYIGTEHILIALLRVPESVAAVVLDRLNIRDADVRRIIDITLSSRDRIVIQQIIPTSRVKQIIELSFTEARRMGDGYVSTEHILLGMLIEGEGVGAHVLNDLGATLENVTAEIEAVRKEGTIVEGPAPPGSITSRGASSRYRATSASSGLSLVLFDRADEGAGETEPLYVNPMDVVRVDPAGEDSTKITLRQGGASTVVVKGGVHEVARRLME